MLGLRWEDVFLDGESPTVRVRASITKNRKDSELPLSSDLARSLRAYRPADAAPFAPVFACGLPNFRTVRRDLVRAGVPFKDEQERRIDFHALRVTFCTNLSLAKVDPRTVMALMRHSDLRLTMKTYPDAGLSDTGLPQQCEIFDRIADRQGTAPPVVLASDVLKHPRGLLEKLCAALGIPFRAEMLTWEPGRRGPP